ncbi:MAG: twin-arginine translocase subunit TatC [Desulfuromonadales bacterium]|nr:twin-arginine translocase subunit TatC [Desulfuromonadales bacterium]
MDDGRMSLMHHLEELRKRVVRAGIAWLVAFMICYNYAEQMYLLISRPLRDALPAGTKLVFLTATEPFFAYLKIGAFAGLLVALPVIFWQLWGFIAPGLYAHEKRYVIPFVVLSSACFIAGTAFGFIVAFPLMFGFLVQAGTAGGEVIPMLSMGSYLSLAGQMLLAFGITFELPIVIFFLARIGVVDYAFLSRNRKYALLICFILGAIFSPPDVVSQTVLAVPMFILYEVGIWLAYFFGKKKAPVADEPTAADAA